jgi:hypothetical protein
VVIAKEEAAKGRQIAQALHAGVDEARVARILHFDSSVSMGKEAVDAKKVEKEPHLQTYQPSCIHPAVTPGMSLQKAATLCNGVQCLAVDIIQPRLQPSLPFGSRKLRALRHEQIFADVL